MTQPKSATKSTRTKKAPLLPVEIVLALDSSHTQTLLECAIQYAAESEGIEDVPKGITTDALRRNPNVMKSLEVALRQSCEDFLLGVVFDDGESQVISALVSALLAEYSADIDAQVEKERRESAEREVTIKIKRKNEDALKAFLRKHNKLDLLR